MRRSVEESDLDDIPMMEDNVPEEDYDDLDEYSFSKFASMYFQGAATPTHIRQRLRQPLLYHEDEGDVLVLSYTIFTHDSPFHIRIFHKITVTLCLSSLDLT